MTLEATGIRLLPLWMLVAYLVTFVATRLVTRAIRLGRGPFRDTSVGGVHVHHQVYGIFLLLVAGAAEFTWRPGPPADVVLAALFGIGAALTLDESRCGCGSTTSTGARRAAGRSTPSWSPGCSARRWCSGPTRSGTTRAHRRGRWRSR